MNWRLPLLLLTATAAFAADDGTTASPETAQDAAAAKRGATDGTAQTGARTGADQADQGVVKMSPVLVTSTNEAIFRSSEPKAPLGRPFDLREGGTILKHRGPRLTTEFKFQYNPVHKGWDLFSISW